MAIERLAVCVNPRYSAITQFTGYDCNSFARFGDRFLGANEDGLFLLGADDDNGASINAYFVTKTTDFGDFRTKRFHRAYLGLRGTGPMELSMSADDGRWTGFAVPLEAQQHSAQHGSMVPLNSKITGRYWTFMVSNLGGSDFTIDTIQLINSEKKQVALLRGTTGLNAKVDPARVTYDPKRGVMDLVQAINVQVDDSFAVSRRKGFSLLQAGQFHSLFCASSHCLVIQEHASVAALYRVNDDLTLTGIRSGLTKGRHMAFHSLNGLVYYSNGIESGIYVEEAGASVPWTKGENVGLTMDREVYDPPPARHISTLGLHMILADALDRSLLWISSDAGFNAFNLDDGHIDLSSPVTMIKAVQDGLWIGTDKETLFLAGMVPDEWVVGRRLPYGVKEFSASHELVSAERMGIEAFQGEGAFWLSSRGVCWGGPTGQILEMGHRNVDPREFSGHKGACLVGEDKLIFTLER
jgi:hypothetical protein